MGKKSAAGGRYRTPTPLSCSPSLPLSRGAGGGCIFSFFPPLSVSLPSHQLAYLPPLTYAQRRAARGRKPCSLSTEEKAPFPRGAGGALSSSLPKPKPPILRSSQRWCGREREPGRGERERGERMGEMGGRRCVERRGGEIRPCLLPCALADSARAEAVFSHSLAQ